MSADAIGWVFRHSPYRHGALSVHLALADAANDLHGHEVYFGVPRLAAKARVGRSTVISALSAMTTEGFLEEVSPQRGSASPTVYRMLFPDDAPLVYDDGSRAKSGLVRKSDQSGKRAQLVQIPKPAPITNPKNPITSSRPAKYAHIDRLRRHRRNAGMGGSERHSIRRRHRNAQVRRLLARKG